MYIIWKSDSVCFMLDCLYLWQATEVEEEKNETKPENYVANAKKANEQQR